MAATDSIREALLALETAVVFAESSADAIIDINPNDVPNWAFMFRQHVKLISDAHEILASVIGREALPRLADYELAVAGKLR